MPDRVYRACGLSRVVRSRLRCSFALACALQLGIAARGTSAQDRADPKLAPLTLRYSAPAQCPTREAFAAALAARLFRAPSGGRFEIQAVFETKGGGVRARVIVRDAAGAVRSREIQARQCQEAVDALALITALALQGEAAGDPERAVGASAPARPRGGEISRRRSADAARAVTGGGRPPGDAARSLEGSGRDGEIARERGDGSARERGDEPGGARGDRSARERGDEPERERGDGRTRQTRPALQSIEPERPGAEGGSSRAAQSGASALRPAEAAQPQRDAASAEAALPGVREPEALGSAGSEPDREALRAEPIPRATPVADDGGEEKRARARSGRRFELGLLAAGLVASGIGPRWQPGFQLGVQLQLAAESGVHLGARLAGRLVPPSELERAGGDVRFAFSGGSLALCAGAQLSARLLAAEGCMTAEAGALSARGVDTQNAGSFERPWFALGPALGVSWLGFAPLLVRLDIELLFPTVRDRFRLAGASLHEVPADVVRAALSFGLQL
jgi:hypothetical protein